MTARSHFLLLVALTRASLSAGWAPLPAACSLERHPLSAGRASLPATRARTAPPRCAALLSSSDDEIDVELAKCDMAVLSIHSLVHSTAQIVGTGTFDPTPSITADDLIDIAHAFNDAASSALGWFAAAVILSRWTGIMRRPLEREPVASARVVLLVFCLGGPLALALKSLAVALERSTELVDLVAVADALRGDMLDLPLRLALMIGWRAFLAPAIMF
jgi:hypothetical protein